MVYDDIEADELITRLEEKRKHLESLISDIRYNVSIIRELKDVEKPKLTPDGVRMISDTGDVIFEKVPATDRSTKKPISKTRRNEVYDSRKEDAERLLL